MAADITHVALMARARRLEQAAIADDLDAVHAELCGLRNALVDHLHAEADSLEGLGTAVAEVISAGQHRLLSTVDELLNRVGDGDGADCACVQRSLEVTRALARQARLETAVLRDHAQRRPGR
ncbi:MAG: hypothetical protein KDB35_04710 [Acidimicrobiales bacterium]|nr:hypothetical protein [Acidimicrobiales bacterium]MCB1014550.1 hypothetical protein [Acidimicrobiales bacterium]